jgi:hypothetical protein
MAGVGLLAFAARGWRDPLAGWAFFNWLALMVMRATPFAPGHDGIRQFVACFPYFALLAGFGVLGIQRLCGTRIGILAAIAACGSAGVAWYRIQPFELSYYSEAIGGLPGAQRLGLETTYWWDAVMPELLQVLDQRMPQGAKIGLSGHYLKVFAYYQQSGRLRRDLVFIPLNELLLSGADGPMLRPLDFLLILNREGMLLRTEHSDRIRLTPLLERLQKALHGKVEYAVECQGVRLLALVRAEEMSKD